MKNMVNYMLSGLGIGAFSYLLALLSVKEVTVTMIVSVLVISALIGLSAMVYEWQELSLTTRGSLHLLVVLLLIVAMLFINGIFNITALVVTAVIYALVLMMIKYTKVGSRHE